MIYYYLAFIISISISILCKHVRGHRLESQLPSRHPPARVLPRKRESQDAHPRQRLPSPPQQIEALRLALAGSLAAVGSPLPDAFLISRSLPHGHAAAVLGCLRNLQLDTILDPVPSRQRALVLP